MRICDWSSDVCPSDPELRDYPGPPVDAPIVAAFDLAPGAAKTVRAIALLPKEVVNVVTVQGRPMFVPLVAINAVYHWDGGDGQTATSHVVGIAQPGPAKMPPFWPDADRTTGVAGKGGSVRVALGGRRNIQ